MVVGDELAVGVGVLIEAYGEHGDAGHLLLELDESRQLFEAGWAPRGPEVQDDNFAPVLVEAYSLCSVVDGEGWGLLRYLCGMAAPIAGGDDEA